MRRRWRDIFSPFKIKELRLQRLEASSYHDGKVDLWRADADGSNSQKVADEVGDSQCSSGGKWVFYGRKEKIYRMPIEGGEPVAVVTVPEVAIHFEFHPTGTGWRSGTRKAVRFQCRNSRMVATAGGALQVVSQVPLGARGLYWAPSGKALQYVLTRNGASNIWEQPLTGGTPQQVTKFTSGLIFDFAWSRDRKQLVLTRGNRTSDVILISHFK